MNAQEKKEARNQYLDLSNELSEITTKVEFHKWLPKVLPFLEKFHNTTFAGYIIDDVRVFELNINK